MTMRLVDLEAVVRRQQDAAHPSVPSAHWRNPVGRLAADTFALVSENRRLREALEPFAALGKRLADYPPGQVNAYVSVSDCKRAKEVLG